MGEPWDARPKLGNRSSRVLYEAIGRALTTWELLETYLADLYAAFCEADCFDEKANHSYGKPLNFYGRIIELRRAACEYFVKHPNQSVEAEFCWVVKFTNGFSHRRNDVAHGVVAMLHMARDPQETILSGLGPPQWCLVPPHFREAKFVSPETPAHILTSREINAFTNAFWPIKYRKNSSCFLLLSNFHSTHHAEDLRCHQQEDH